MKKSRISRLVHLVQKASWDLGLKPTASWMEEIGLQVYGAMDQPTRVFHQVDHVFEVAANQRGIGIFAALYHDIIYLQIDGGIPDACRHVLDSSIRIEGPQLHLREESALPPLSLGVIKIFGLQPGQALLDPVGKNEFLSALTAVTQMREVLNAKQLLQIAAYIEATIPFRIEVENGKDCFDNLADNLRAAYVMMHLNENPQEIEGVVKESVQFANGDVSNFARRDTGSFLVETWKLHSEMNPSLRQTNSFYFRSYRQSLVHGLHFFQTLEPERVFRSYRDTPNPGILKSLTEQVNINLNIAVRYIEVKLLTIGIMEAIAELSGGDAPISMLLGESDTSGAQEHIEDFLKAPAFRIDPDKCRANMVYRLLATGKSQSGFDMASSPLATYVHDVLGEEQALQLCCEAMRYFKDECSAVSFLSKIAPTLTDAIINACSSICTTRADRLRDLQAKLDQERRPRLAQSS